MVSVSPGKTGFPKWPDIEASRVMSFAVSSKGAANHGQNADPLHDGARESGHPSEPWPSMNEVVVTASSGIEELLPLCGGKRQAERSPGCFLAQPERHRRGGCNLRIFRLPRIRKSRTIVLR